MPPRPLMSRPTAWLEFQRWLYEVLLDTFGICFTAWSEVWFELWLREIEEMDGVLAWPVFGHGVCA